MQLRTFVAGLILVSVIPFAGCRMIVQQAINEAKGAQATIIPITDPSSAALARFNSVQFDPCTTETGERVTPSALLRAYDRGTTEALTKDLANKLRGGEPTLTIRTALYYFQSKGIFSGAELIGRTRFFDGGSQIGDVIVKGESSSYLAGDEDAMAYAMVKAIVKYLAEKRGPQSVEPK